MSHALLGWRAGLLFPAGFLHWERGEQDAAKEILARMARQPGEAERAVGAFSRQALQGLIGIHDARQAAGIPSLHTAAELQRAHPYLLFFGDMRLAVAYGHLVAGAPDHALAAARPALEEWSRSGLPGMVLTLGHVILPPVLELALKNHLQPDFARRVVEALQRLKGPRPLQVPVTGESLTPREVEVLYLLATGATNQTIADELVISLATVKTHVSRILAKLDVRTRGEAVSRARALKLL
jgi:DNA-binding CsgD family transcriptional regulator